MSEVKWIKITTNMFEDEKIKLIEALPERDTILIIWVKLLAQAGKCNATGHLVLSEKIPYTDEMLSTIFNRPLNTVRLALETFKNFGMIEYDELIKITNWEKHQNIEGLEKIREQNRLRKQKQRERERQNQLMSRDMSHDITQQNKNKKENKKENKKDKKNTYGEYKNVKLTDKEYQKLNSDYNNLNSIIKFFDEYIEEKGYKSKSHNLAIRRWVVEAVERQNKNTGGNNDESRGTDNTNTKEDSVTDGVEKDGIIYHSYGGVTL